MQKFARIFSRRRKQTTFSNAGFLGILTVELKSSYVDNDVIIYGTASELRMRFPSTFPSDSFNAVPLLRCFFLRRWLVSYVAFVWLLFVPNLSPSFGTS